MQSPKTNHVQLSTMKLTNSTTCNDIMEVKHRLRTQRNKEKNSTDMIYISTFIRSILWWWQLQSWLQLHSYPNNKYFSTTWQWYLIINITGYITLIADFSNIMQIKYIFYYVLHQSMIFFIRRRIPLGFGRSH